MDQTFLSRFHPRLIDVIRRDQRFWEHWDYVFTNSNKPTSMRNFIYVFDGVGTLELNGSGYPLSAGAAFYFPLNSVFKMTSSRQTPIRYISVLYDFKLVEWEGNSAKCSDPGDKGLPLPVFFYVQDQHRMFAMMQDIYERWHAKAADYEWQSKLIFYNILHAASDQQAREDQGQRSISRCLDYIKKHYAEPIDRSVLAHMACLSLGHFSVVFKKHTGYTPSKYINRIRLDKAKELLQNSSWPIAEVAREVGFKDPLYFARAFAHETGLSPSEYRKM